MTKPLAILAHGVHHYQTSCSRHPVTQIDPHLRNGEKASYFVVLVPRKFPNIAGSGISRSFRNEIVEAEGMDGGRAEAAFGVDTSPGHRVGNSGSSRPAHRIGKTDGAGNGTGPEEIAWVAPAG
jgi:hypothetical protein